MKLNAQTPKFALNKAFLKQRPLRSEIEQFKANLKTLLAKVEAKESEENKKNHVRDFLLETYYKGKNEVNTKDRKDLVIHLGKTNDSNVGVIIEAKTPESADRVKTDKLNAKAFHELVLYYFDERHTKNNSELKNLIVTNTYEWFIFDVNIFDKQIYRNSQIKRLYDTYKNDKKDNPFFYEELRKILETLDEEIVCTHFNLRDYETFLNNSDLEDDKNLIELYKILSPYHLLKVPFANDSNALNKPFYDELLHIIGLEEVKIKSKSIIRRKEDGNRNAGSLLENAITILKTKDSLRKVSNIADYGAEIEKRYENVALELCITWINRILFLKLLEAQLVNYHRGNREYRFLNVETISDFDELFTLFHQVLAKTFEDREPNIREKYKRVPYLNSSLFEISELEDATISIESLKNIAFPFNNSTILKDFKAQGKTLNTLEYLFKFLDAYDFASEGAEDVQADNRSLINASVLGKVFEKINGYKDGSIFTPGFITMYMCRQAIRLAVIQKFKDRYEIDIETFDELKNFIGNVYKTEKIKEYNALINEIHLCDPAVGSGHFLVSSLNEIIAIKSELGILADETNVRLSDFEIHIENDELIITDERGDIFEYQINADGKPTAKAQRLQKTLFHEKQTIIENCLFGVDINPNSVKICRLRLWIELLKNAYYKENQGFAELETLPNIDINIKQGNSLLSRFKLDDDLSQVLKTLKYSVKDYRNFVLGYKETRDREAKRDFETKIKQIKDDFKTQLFFYSPERKKRREIKGELDKILNQPRFFEESEEIKLKEQKKIKELQDKLDKQNDIIKQIEENAIYKNAFEWRFEFPEVLDNEGNFLGFDIVIGNPPYIRQEEIGKFKDYLKKDYQVFAGTADLLVYFYELGIKLLKEKGSFSFITSNKFMRANYGKALREFLSALNLSEIIDFGDAPVFDGVAAYACIVNLQKFNAKSENQTRAYNFPTKSDVPDFETSYKNDGFYLEQSKLAADGWQIERADVLELLDKLRSKGKPLGEYVHGKFYYGIKTGLNEAFVVNREIRDRLIEEDATSAEILKPFLRGRDVKRWQTEPQDLWLIFTRHGTNIDEYPAIKNYLLQFKNRLEPLGLKDQNGKSLTRKVGIYKWYEIQDNIAYWQEFEKPKIILPAIEKRTAFAIDENGFFGNDKTNICVSSDAKYLAAILNSQISWWIIRQTASGKQGGYYEFKPMYVTQIPIKQITLEAQQPFIELVDEILEKKKLGQETCSQENKIDAMVYRLYDLTADEIKIVEGE